jgi:hypothetical protein
MPFFLHAGYHSLSALRELGFKTFDVLWDESYDNIEDPELRSIALHQSIKSVLDQPLDQLDKLILQHKSIIIHNQKRFKELATLNPLGLWIEMHNAKTVGDTDRTVITQLREPNAHIRMKPRYSG